MAPGPASCSRFKLGLSSTTNAQTGITHWSMPPSDGGGTYLPRGRSRVNLARRSRWSGLRKPAALHEARAPVFRLRPHRTAVRIAALRGCVLIDQAAKGVAVPARLLRAWTRLGVEVHAWILFLAPLRMKEAPPPVHHGSGAGLVPGISLGGIHGAAALTGRSAHVSDSIDACAGSRTWAAQGIPVRREGSAPADQRCVIEAVGYAQTPGQCRALR